MRLLFVYWAFPEADTNSGSFRIYEILKILLNQGYTITFLAKDANSPIYRHALENLGVECICDAGRALTSVPTQFANFLRERDFDVAVLSHYFIYSAYAPYLRAFLPNCSLIFDTVDLHFLRLQRQAELLSDPVGKKLAERVYLEEVGAIIDADCLWMVTEKERDIVLQLVSTKEATIYVVPNIHAVEKHLRDYTQRKGIVFLGDYRHPPNVDAISYFMQEVFPPLCQMLPEVYVTIAGNQPPTHFQNYKKTYANVSVTGFVADHRDLLSSHLVGIAPLRYGAGMKGKIGEYLACGLPCVSTSIGVEGMEVEHEREILLANEPIQFAKMIARLYSDVELWQTLSAAGSKYIQRHLSPEAIAPFVLNAIQISQSPRRQEPLEQQLSLLKLDLEAARTEIEQIKDTVTFVARIVKRVRNQPIYKMLRWFKYRDQEKHKA